MDGQVVRLSHNLMMKHWGAMFVIPCWSVQLVVSGGSLKSSPFTISAEPGPSSFTFYSGAGSIHINIMLL